MKSRVFVRENIRYALFHQGLLFHRQNWCQYRLVSDAGINCVVHCAARSHVMDKDKADALAAYRAVNVEGTKNLAEQAAGSGVKRFIF